MVSSMHLEESPLSLEEAAAAIRRRCTSECLTNATGGGSPGGGGYYNCYPGSLNVPRSPLSLSIDEDVDLPTAPAALPEMKKDFMTRYGGRGWGWCVVGGGFVGVGASAQQNLWGSPTTVPC